jgi:phenylalanine-4-hydroxylase
MLQEATLYSPAITTEGGRTVVVFTPDHAGYSDPAYQERRAMIADVALGFRPGIPVPEVAYTAREDELWRVVVGELVAKHEQYACAEFRHGSQLLALSADRVPQLGDVAARLRGLTGFTFTPAAGLVAVQDFYGSLADRRFQATQYIRHASMPRFSPEPDMLHEVIGHGNALANDRFADLYELFGRTVRRLETSDAISVVSSVFWFAMEYGTVREHGGIKAVGASLLSSCAELDRFQHKQIEPLDAAVMARQGYHVDTYQPVLFCAESFDHLEDYLGEFLSTVKDTDAPRILTTRAAQPVS